LSQLFLDFPFGSLQAHLGRRGQRVARRGQTGGSCWWMKGVKPIAQLGPTVWGDLHLQLFLHLSSKLIFFKSVDHKERVFTTCMMGGLIPVVRG